MYEKGLIVLMFMVCIGVGVLSMQFVAGDIMGITLTNYKGEEIKSSIVGSLNVNALQNATTNIVSANYTLADQAAAFVKAGDVFKELFLLATGLYIFNILVALGIPIYLVTLMLIPYVLLLARMAIALIRGI